MGNLGTFELEDLLRFMMISYQEEKSISFSYNVTYTHLGVNNNLFVDEDLYDTVEKDGNGNIVKTVKLDTENNIEMTCIYSTTGELITEIFNDKNNKEYHEKHYDKGKTGKKLYQ